LWEILEEYSRDDRKAFLRFICGRSRLPVTRKDCQQTIVFKIQSMSKMPPDKYLPVSHTCFFSIELPRYSSKALMKQKLTYSIYNCFVIDGDETVAGLRYSS
jgi:hypothetical protein